MNLIRIITVFLAAGATASAATKVRIEGLTTKSESELLYLIGGRLEHVEKDRASLSTADDAAFLVTQVMRKDGFADVNVVPKIVNSSEILLIVNEGWRRSLGKVEVNGVEGVEDAAKIRRLYESPASKDRPIGSGSAPFREEDVGKGLAMVRQELNAMGYWTAEADLVNRSTGDKGDVNLQLQVKQGPLHTIARPRMTSGDGRGIDLAETNAAPFVGKPATTANLNGMRKAVEDAFVTTGYPDAKIRMGKILEGGRFIPDFSIDIGKRVKLRDINIAGLERTNPTRVEQRMSDFEGDWYNEAAMNKRLSQMLATGAFSSARIEKTEVGPDTIDATLHLREGRAKEVSLAAGFGSYEGAIFRATYSDRNLFGHLLGFSTGLELSSRGVLGETKLVDPWIYGSEFSLTSRLYAMVYGHEGYQSFDTGLESTLSRKFGDHYQIDLLAGYSLINITGDGLPFSELGETVYTHPRLSLTQTVDFRDNPILPKKGWHVKAPIQIGAAVGDDTTSYVKAGLAGGWYHPLGKDFQLSLGGQIGAIVPSGDSTQLPIDLRLFNGGSSTVRSFPERELGPRVDDYPTGGEAAWSANAEVTRAIAGPLRGVFFVDAGSLARDLDSLADAELELATGLGIRIDLPIGPVRLEYGYNLTKDEGEPSGALHFAIGIAF